MANQQGESRRNAWSGCPPGDRHNFLLGEAEGPSVSTATSVTLVESGDHPCHRLKPWRSRLTTCDFMKPGDCCVVPTPVIILRRIIVSALALTSLGLGVYAYNEHEARLAAEDLARSLQGNNAALRKTRAEKKVAPVAKEVVFPDGVTVAPEDSTERPAPEGRSRMANMRAAATDLMGMMDTPEVQQLMALRSRGALDSRYAALFKNLALPPDQLKKFQDLLLDKQNTMRDVLAAMRSQGLAPGPESRDQMRALVQNANAEIDNQIQSTLGSAAFAQYQDYERTQPQRATVDRVQQRLSYSSQPLSDQQAAQLVAVLAQNPPQSGGNGPGGGGGGGFRQLFNGGGGATAPITDQALQQAGTILAPAQLTALQELQQEQQAQAQLARRARDNFAGGRPAPAPPAGKTQ
jgi:hypothetical protein